MNFTIALSGESGGIADISNRMIQSFILTLYGLVLAVVCLVSAMKLASLRSEGASGAAQPDVLGRFSALTFIFLFLLLTFIMVITPMKKQG